ncbi:kinase-like domain-containing protein [Rhizophagus clarus]|uniref:Kinase-like domain-containing protein n=1 Tax=Rhizophagus clarus TaxID=94130 RepID=A0A8H3M9L3_9GLOM|nr:kinase-like domain-containing protein [Rhizophagus clarus]
MYRKIESTDSQCSVDLTRCKPSNVAPKICQITKLRALVVYLQIVFTHAYNQYVQKFLYPVANRMTIPAEKIESLGELVKQKGFSEGTFKRVHHIPGTNYVVQIFKDISDGTFDARIKEVKNERYNQTLKDYVFAPRSQITGEQKYKLILDMVKGIKALHDAGFAHRDLSEVNMMVNVTSEKLADGSKKPELVVIDFGKAEFINHDDVLALSAGESTSDKLEILPYIKTVPDHGYKLYRSAATLPRTRNDHAVLRYPIDPCAEDVYAVGVLAWRIFSGQAPWGGILDTDLKELGEIVSDPIKIKFHIERNVDGKKSRELLLKCITATSEERSTAENLLDWFLQSKDELVSEWSTSKRRKKIIQKPKVAASSGKRRKVNTRELRDHLLTNTLAAGDNTSKIIFVKISINGRFHGQNVIELPNGSNTTRKSLTTNNFQNEVFAFVGVEPTGTMSIKHKNYYINTKREEITKT